MDKADLPVEERQPEAAAISGLRECKIIFLFCLLAAIHVFIFSVIFPLNSNMDELAHFDLVIKYSHCSLPRGLQPMSEESMQYMAVFGSQEFMGRPDAFPDGKFPPTPWTQPIEKVAPVLLARESVWKTANKENSQPPLYYALAGCWWHLGKWCGLEGGCLLYWLRFLNIFFTVALVWMGYLAAQMIFPESFFLRLGVPALLAFIPQTVFYTITNDALLPLSFGAAFVCLMRLLRAEAPDVRLGVTAGLMLAAAFLTKASNLPLIAVALAAILIKARRLAGAGKLKAACPALAVLALCAGLPASGWMAWSKYAFGDFTGSAIKIQFLGWTHKPFAEWFHHPLFTPHGLWTFVSGLLATFWQGEFWWHRQPLASPAVDIAYIILSICFLGAALIDLVSRQSTATVSQRDALWFCFAVFIASAAFLAFLSIIYDFHDCFYPSRTHPYFTSGRLMLGALIPFLLFFVYGIDRALKKFGDPVKFLALGAIILFMLVSEITIDRPVFSSQYNWFHM